MCYPTTWTMVNFNFRSLAFPDTNTAVHKKQAEYTSFLVMLQFQYFQIHTDARKKCSFGFGCHRTRVPTTSSPSRQRHRHNGKTWWRCHCHPANDCIVMPSCSAITYGNHNVQVAALGVSCGLLYCNIVGLHYMTIGTFTLDIASCIMPHHFWCSTPHYSVYWHYTGSCHVG